jgi:hypothetical protein
MSPSCDTKGNPSLFCDLGPVENSNETIFSCKEFPIDKCGRPGGPCSPDWQGQWEAESRGYPTCPEMNINSQSCPEEHYCRQNKSYATCEPRPKDCGKLGEVCCPPRGGLQTVGALYNKLSNDGMYCMDPYARCYAPSGPEYDLASSECIPDVPCGQVGHSCCQPYGFRELTFPKYDVQGESNEGLIGLVCVASAYCVPDEPLEKQWKDSSYLRGTCVRDPKDCGTGEGKPCCVDTWDGNQAVGDWRNRTYCLVEGISCSVGPNDPQPKGMGVDYGTCMIPGEIPCGGLGEKW